MLVTKRKYDKGKSALVRATSALAVVLIPSLVFIPTPATAASVAGAATAPVVEGGTSDTVSKSTRRRRVRRSRRSTRRRRARRRFQRLREGPGFRLLRPRRAWGTRLMVNTLTEVFQDHHQRFPEGPEVWVHDMSRRWGGYLPPHVSHRQGRDVDLRVIKRTVERKKPGKRRYRSVFTSEQNWSLVRGLLATGKVQFIFVDRYIQRRLYREARKQGVSRAALREIFQYPRRRSVREGIIRHEPGHHSHYHVRFFPEESLPPMTVALAGQ